MSSESQTVVVIEDASRDVSLSAINYAAQGLPLKPGDKIIVLRILHQVTYPSMFSLKAGKLLGHRIKVDPDSMFGASKKMIEEEIAQRTEEFNKSEQINQILQQFDLAKIEHHIEVKAAPSLKSVAVEAAKTFQATWVILDRKMKKDEKFLMGRLTCGISRVKRNNKIEKLRVPKKLASIRVTTGRKSTERRNSSVKVKYGEMMPGSSEDELSKRESQNGKLIRGNDGSDHSLNVQGGSTITKSSSSEQFVTPAGPAPCNAEASSSSYTETKYSPVPFQSEETTERETAWEYSPNYMDIHEMETENSTYESPDNIERQHSSGDKVSQTNEGFRNNVCSICRNRRPKIGWKRDFTYVELQAATEGFNPRNFLSEGGFGSVYRGAINGIKIAVKQHKNISSQGEKEFKSEVNVLSKARHENLVMLLGSCSEGNHRILVYEYVCNGSLDQHLSKHSRRLLTWQKRMKIALGAAKGLQYLHGISIIHRDMRPNNILVTHDYEALFIKWTPLFMEVKRLQGFEFMTSSFDTELNLDPQSNDPKLGDFGLAKTQYEDKEMSSETRLVGTLGYLAPEYAEYGKVSTKTDVYSFGVVLLQLITGLKTTDKELGGKSLVGWARPLLKERNYPDLIDHRIVDTHDVHQLYWMVRVAEKCLIKDPKKRLSMDQVVDALNDIIEGKTVCCLREFSPARSESLYSFADSGESQVDNRSVTLEPTSTDNVGSGSMRLPPSPSLRVISSGGSSMSSS